MGEVPHNLLSSLGSRDVALWVRSLPENQADKESLVRFLGLPWRMVISEIYDQGLFKALDATESVSSQMVRKRGFVQIIDSDPSRIELPERCLPIYLLNGQMGLPAQSDFESRLRRMTILEQLRRSGTREVLVISHNVDPIPPDLKDLWSSGFRAFLTFVSDDKNAEKALGAWLGETDGVAAVNLLEVAPSRAVQEILTEYVARYPEDRHVIRVRDVQGIFHRVDVTEADEPERPILEHYSLVEERDITPLVPEELTEGDFIAFFQNPEASWRPYAAGLPWVRDAQCRKKLGSCLKKLDAIGSEESCIAYVSCEPGAGGTTLARMLAWECAREGYPVLVARPVPFVPDALPVANFLNRVRHQIDNQTARDKETTLKFEGNGSGVRGSDGDAGLRRYETPWVIVFDSLHWQYRDNELVRYINDLEKSGRPVCVLVVTGPVLGLSFFNTAIFKEVAQLNHALDQSEARQLGRHLNRFLRVYGKERQDSQWDRFYQEHTVRYLEGTSAFWVTLSFWIQGQYDLSESIQQWMYRSFKENVAERVVQDSILEIAALSSERLPLPETLLPTVTGQWPVSHLLDDARASLGALGLVRISTNGEKHWALVHDILGRFLINALFYDFQMRNALGFGEAKDSEHLRFMLLRQISQKPFLGERVHRAIGEDFATSIFKVDPDHGRASFASFWREVLDALDSMPRSLRDTSRVFRHHTAISRRRIAKLDSNFYGVNTAEKITLLERAIEDINYALNFIEYTSGSESNVNLYNSLSNAYLDLARIETERGTEQGRIFELRRLANDATRKAYGESPTNSFVIETYIKNLLENTQESPELTIENCVEALGIIYSTLSANEGAYRRSHLGVLGDQALDLLLRQAPAQGKDVEPTDAIDVLVMAWRVLAEGATHSAGMELIEIPEANREQALKVLTHPAGKGNMQVLRLTLDLTCASRPYAFREQLELVEQLLATDYRVTPQLRLEYAILLFQNNRAAEGERVFRSLRQLWRESEHFIQIPERLRWLRGVDGTSLQAVHAIAGSDYGHRAMARVQEFANALVPFRPEEHGIHDLRPGLRFVCHVSFGHNGPFLRPVTAHPYKSE
ncbi:MAG: hypothetical protein ACTHNV_10655 [Ralstonia sp.]|uniref:hypothetical protein n=1 Tax=Ralstonia sp. TaxID=54061 RepID=UPI003F7CDF73